MTDKICAYEGCSEHVNRPHDDEYCVFHAPKEKKGISNEFFNELIFGKIEKKNYKFQGYIFPEAIDFSKCKFSHIAQFEKAKFESRVKFHNTIFERNAIFNKCEFKDDAIFRTARFGYGADFKESIFIRNATFLGASFDLITEFCETKFKLNAIFKNARFNADSSFSGINVFGTANFNETNFLGNSSFIKAKFKKDIIFNNAKFRGWAYFSNSIFLGKANLEKVKFEGESNFSGTKFAKDVNFRKATFDGDTNFSADNFDNKDLYKSTEFQGKVDFTYSQFKNDAIFMGTKFYKLADFSKSTFNKTSNFKHSHFQYIVEFSNVLFRGEVFFNNTLFGHGCSFNLAHFLNNIVFIDNQISGYLNFVETLFSEKCIFYFKNATFKIIEDSKIEKNILINRIRVIFKRVRFNSFASYFENINVDIANKPIFIFRYCQLKDVFFTNNDMSLFSFYKSSYDKARLISCLWGEEDDRILKIFKYDRKNIIPEDNLLKELTENITDDKQSSQFRNRYEIEDLNNYKDIASLYRQMKTALDNSKDYQQAGWFYFNELEMKRRALEDEIENSKPKWKIFQWQPVIWLYQQLRKLFSKYIFYFLYKVLTGYGEKPLWSSIWLGVCIVVFTILNFCIGIKIGTKYEDEIIKYSDATIWDSLIFTLYRIIPTNYLPFKYTFDVPHNFWGLLIPFLNTAVLIIMFAFIVIGLKRHFRRF